MAFYLRRMLYPECFHQYIQLRNMKMDSVIPVIKIPAKGNNAKQNDKKVIKRGRRYKVVNLRPGDKTKPIITGRNVSMNHYVGKEYIKEDVPLASKGWMNKKSIGDQFTFHNYMTNPSLTSSDGDPIDFNDLGVDSKLISNLKESGFIHPTNIQADSIPVLLKGNNGLISSETGNGKTLAFLIPLLQNIYHFSLKVQQREFNAPIGIIITPSRELAIQIKRIADKLVEDMNLSISIALGGKIKKKVLNPQMKNVHLLIGSFGAISKLTTLRIYKLTNLRHIVLDEVDTLLDDSFKDKIVHFLKRFPIQGMKASEKESELLKLRSTNDLDINENETLSGVQIILSGATIPKDIIKILQSVVQVDSLSKLRTSYLHKVQPHVEQTFIRVSHETKMKYLLKAVKKSKKNNQPTLIFCNTSESCDWVGHLLNSNNIECGIFHANMPLDKRYGVFDQFQKGFINFLACTDIASRGLDTVRAVHVINADFPKYISDYIHRCGRVGRVGNSQKTFVTNLIHTPLNIKFTQEIEYSLRRLEELPRVNANIKRLINVHINSNSIKDELD